MLYDVEKPVPLLDKFNSRDSGYATRISDKIGHVSTTSKVGPRFDFAFAIVFASVGIIIYYLRRHRQLCVSRITSLVGDVQDVSSVTSRYVTLAHNAFVPVSRLLFVTYAEDRLLSAVQSVMSLRKVPAGIACAGKMHAVYHQHVVALDHL